MKKPKIGIYTVICILLLTAMSATVSVNAMSSSEPFKNSIISKYCMSDENKVKSDLKKLKNNELLDEINSLSVDVSSNELIPFVSELFERKDELNNSDILAKIKDNSNSITTQEILVDLYTSKNENNLSQNDMKNLLKDTNVKKEIKSRIVSNSEFDNNDSDLLKNLINDDTGILAFNSLKQLSKINGKEAYSISNNILSNFSSESNLRISAAQKAAAKFLRNSNDINAKNSFINQTIEIINNSQTDTMLKDSSVFALSDMMSKEAIENIIGCESIDSELKAFSIEQNSNVLKEILENKYCEESDIELVVQAMEILPIADIYPSLKNVQAVISDKGLKKRYENALQNIQLNGIKATNKWED